MKTCDFCGKKRKYYGNTNDGKCLCMRCFMAKGGDSQGEIDAYMMSHYGELDEDNESPPLCQCPMDVLKNRGCQCGGK